MTPLDPAANFSIRPRRPSTRDTVQLVDCSRDPGEVGIAWRAWDFGDGSTSVGTAPVHRYTAAGVYEVVLTVATFDGRIARGAQTVQVSDPASLAGC
jgi:PKD repeat protein